MHKSRKTAGRGHNSPCKPTRRTVRAQHRRRRPYAPQPPRRLQRTRPRAPQHGHAQTYAQDVVWHEPDRVVRGREALARRAAGLRAQTPDLVFRPDGPVSVNDGLVLLGFRFGLAGQAPVATEMGVARCKDGVIVELYTFVSGSSQPS
ncbi:nuclear transport factor 2 family protein [Streptomyces sp. NPDC059161]|uniref:nuclear transport factor 2 family protein n=1 Tax=unclassified Streptomyces TaxID=2593676 RepID=UPI0036588F37